MNKLMIIGNLTRDPVLRTTTTGKQVCSFTVAVNRRKTQANQDPGADYFNVSTWDQQAVNCSKFLQKGRKVAVVGAVSVRLYTGNNGQSYANLEVQAQEVEFLTSLSDVSPVAPPDTPPAPTAYASAPPAAAQQQTMYDAMNGAAAPAGFTPVEDDELPF